MTRLRFLILDVRHSSPQEWLRMWAGLYEGYDEKEYRDLIGKYESLSAEDFVRIGKWKDGVKTKRQWKPNVASVAYLIWMQTAQELPKCLEGSDLAAFLDDWSGRTYTDVFKKKGPVKKHFGLHWQKVSALCARPRSPLAMLPHRSTCCPEMLHSRTARSMVPSLARATTLLRQRRAVSYFRLAGKNSNRSIARRPYSAQHCSLVLGFILPVLLEARRSLRD